MVEQKSRFIKPTEPIIGFGEISKFNDEIINCPHFVAQVGFTHKKKIVCFCAKTHQEVVLNKPDQDTSCIDKGDYLLIQQKNVGAKAHHISKIKDYSQDPEKWQTGKIYFTKLPESIQVNLVKDYATKTKKAIKKFIAV